MLQVVADGMPPMQLRLSGRVQEMVRVPVLRRGDAARATSCWPATCNGPGLRVGLARGDVVRAAGQAKARRCAARLPPASRLRWPISGGRCWCSKGAPLVLTLDGPGLALTAQGIANEAGGLGERIHVTNPYSRAVLEADIIGPGQVRVAPGTPHPPRRPSQVAVR